MSAAAQAADASDPIGATRPSVGGRPSPPSTGLVSIGEVLAQLREEFPDVTISKLRFLEAEGLVEPQRTPAGYRKYSRADVDRLRYVLAAQRDRFLPLRVIRDYLAAMDRGEPDALAAAPPAPQGPDGVHPPGAPDDMPLAALGDVDRFDRDPSHSVDTADDAAQLGPPVRARYSRAELLDRSGCSDAMLIELEGAGLLVTRSPGWYDRDALVVAEVAAALAGYGLAPRHLRAYRTGADREVGMFTQLLAPLYRSATPAARKRAEQAMHELTTLSQRLHAALVRIGLRDTLGQ